MKFQIYFGAMSEPIRKQLARQKIRAQAKDVERYQKIADSITACFLHHCLTEGETGKARKRLFNKMSKELSHQP